MALKGMSDCWGIGDGESRPESPDQFRCLGCKFQFVQSIAQRKGGSVIGSTEANKPFPQSGS